MELFNNKDNDYLKFKINSEGVNINNIEPRLILTTNENKNYLFIGILENGICKFDIPELQMYEKGDNGKIKFEIISEELYFPVWEDTFEIKTKSSIKIEEMVSEKKEESKKPSIKMAEPIIEKKVDSIKEEKSIVDKKEIKPKPQTIHQNIPQYKEPIKSGDIKGYKDFFN